MVADVAPGAGGLRWATPLGWAEELRPFTGARPLVLLPLAAATVLLLAAAARIAATRDIGQGLLPARDTARPRTALLGSTTALAARLQRAGFAAWLAGVAAFSVVLGGVAHAVADAVSGSLSRELAKLGTQAANTPAGFIGFTFEFFVLAVALFACFELAALRDEEAGLQLETLLAQPVSRVRWLASRLALVAVGCAALGLTAGLLTWVAAVSQGADLSFSRMVEAGANCLPAALLYLALGGLAFAVVPRATAAVAYGIVALTFLLEVLGALADVPGWVRAISPFHHIGLVPAAPFDTGGAIGMLAVAALAAGAAVWRFRARDIVAA
jgi:ABC-2 type transport system permease protein